jgi:hypothetical protein
MYCKKTTNSTNGGCFPPPNTIEKSFPPKTIETLQEDILHPQIYSLHDVDHQQIALDSTEIKGKEVLLSHLSHCVVTIYAPLSALRLTHIRECTIEVGPISAAAMIDHSEASSLQLACHQLRIHHSRHLSLFVHVASRPVIEHCDQLEFGVYSLNYPEREAHFEVGDEYPTLY